MPVPGATCGTAVDIVIPFEETFDNTAFATDGSLATACYGGAGNFHAGWYKWTAPDNLPFPFIRVDDTAVLGIGAVYTGTCGALSLVGCACCGSSSELVWAATPGTTYYILLISYTNTAIPDFYFFLRNSANPDPSTNFCIELTCGAPPPPVGPLDGCVPDLSQPTPTPLAGCVPVFPSTMT